VIEFRYPELILLAIPVGIAFHRWGRTRGVTGILRIALLAVLLLTLTAPMLNLGGRGIDVIVVVDRSRSMPDDAHGNILELIHNLQNHRGADHRVGVVTFGARPAVESAPRHQGKTDQYVLDVLPDGSDLNAALETALSLADRNRPTRILVLSDGEANGVDPVFAARKAREERIPIDYRLFERNRLGDVAIDAVGLPESVAPREPFQFPVWIYSDRETEAELTVKRENELLSRQTVSLNVGANRVLFRDVIDQGGFFNYTAELDVPGDPLLENNVGAGIVRVESGPKLLVLNADGQPDNLTRALVAGRIDVQVAAAREHPLTQDSLDPFRAVILENVPAQDLGRLKMERLVQFTEDLGGGLMLTGGERSFGTGGYFKSALDATMPVSMEMREEQRKSRIAMAIVLDRSGSMAMPVKGNRTKMDLANTGTAECVNLLSSGDSVAVLAVDTSPHVIQEMTPVDNKEAIVGRIKKIESMGGGIYVYTGLVAAGRQLLRTDQATKHIILFSDAQDSEEPGDYKTLLAEFAAAGISVSVIGLGTEHDVDADLLKDIAKRGNGNIMFTEDPEELPRLFAEDTMSVARSTFITPDESQPDGIPGAILPDARLMGELGADVFPPVGGYNLSYLKPNATSAVVTRDEYQAPLSAFWYRGLGRAAALCLEVDGQHSGPFARWDNYEDFLITHARWLLGGSHPDDVFVELQREGQDAVVTVELDPDRTDNAETPELIVVPPGDEREQPVSPDFIWTGPHTLQARFPLDRTGSFRTIVKTGRQRLARGPAVTLPYSPEFAPRAGNQSGAEILQSLAETSGGTARTDVLEIFKNPPRSPSKTSLLPYLFIASIVLLLIEIAGRRLSLWERLKPVEEIPRTADELAGRRKTSWIPKWKLALPKRKQQTSAEPSSASESSPPASEPPPEPAKPSRTKADIFAAAKHRAKKRR
jgi:Mg-chelatase subunit ChlD